MDEYLKFFFELSVASFPIKLACIDIFTNIFKNSSVNLTSKLNQAAYSYGLSNKTKIYETLINGGFQDAEMVYSHVNLFNEII